MKYLDKSFSTTPPNDAYRDGYDRTFGTKSVLSAIHVDNPRGRTPLTLEDMDDWHWCPWCPVAISQDGRKPIRIEVTEPAYLNGELMDPGGDEHMVIFCPGCGEQGGHESRANDYCWCEK